MEKLIRIILNVLILMLTVIMIYSLLETLLLVTRSIIFKNEMLNFLEPKIDKTNLFITTVQGFISATLLITILIEVIESLREYQHKDKFNYINVIVEIAIIAVVRHILILDYEHVESSVLLGLSSLILVLGLIYFVINDKIKFRN